MLKNKKLIIIICIALASVVAIAGIILGFIALNKFHIEIKPQGDTEITLEYGESYTDPGASAAVYGKWIYKNGKPVEVVTENTIDTSKVGEYTVKYTANYKKLSAEFIRKVSVKDTAPPVITLNGDAEVSITKGKKFEDAGIVAQDNYDGDISSNVTVSGSVDAEKTGEYVITYEIKDSSGNTATATRKVTVKEPPKKVTVTVQEQPSVNPGQKVVYLTFDDGPGPYTAKLLDVLKKYNVPATFFVTNNNPSYNHLFSRMTSEGHAIAIHTATHNYKQIYASEDAFFADLYKMQNIIKAQTGVTTTLTRFPGGSSNMVSSFNPGIMSSLVNSVTAKGFRYFDWNVTSGDAGETTSTSQVAKNVINGMATHSVSVVLQHDIKSFSVNAVEQIIQWGLANGYTFKACDMTSPTCHHGVNN